MTDIAVRDKPPALLQFWLRILFYYLFLLIPMVHPATVVSADLSILWGLLGLIPLEAILAYYRIPFPGKRKRTWVWPLLLGGISLSVMGWTGTTIPYLLIGLWAYAATGLAFHRRMTWLLIPEPFFLALSMLRLLSFSRSVEQASPEGPMLTPLVMALLLVGFAGYLLVIYRIHQQGKKGGTLWKEALLLLALALSALLIVPLLPERFNPDLMRREKLNERRPDSRGGNGSEEGGDGEEEDSNQGGDDGGSLEMVSESEWGRGLRGDSEGENGEGAGSSPAKQYMVMVVQSDHPIAYMAEEYFGVLDEEEGFISDPEYSLNQLYSQRYLETWKNPEPLRDLAREPMSIRIFSTLPDNFIPYFPYMLEPMVRDDRYYPLAYTYRTLSYPSRLTPGGRDPFVPPMNQDMREEMASYLELPLDDLQKARFQEYLEGIVEPEMNSSEKVEAILHSFSDHQYQIGFTDDVSVDALDGFLFDTKEGDCTEFSNTAALLARAAGVPSRVVTGFIVSRQLQNPSHVMGLMELRKVVQPLAEIPMEELYLITTAHRHSWPQFYHPRYGWVDYESTSYAIPPPMGGNMNDMNVVIPRIYPIEDHRFILNLPWGMILRTLLIIGAVLILFQYSRRRVALLRLRILSRRDDAKGQKSLYYLLIQRYNGREKTPKDPSLTPRELAQRWPEFDSFARLYESTLLNPRLTEAERAMRMEQLRSEYRRLMQNHGDLTNTLREFFSLREVR